MFSRTNLCRFTKYNAIDVYVSSHILVEISKSYAKEYLDRDFMFTIMYTHIERSRDNVTESML